MPAWMKRILQFVVGSGCALLVLTAFAFLHLHQKRSNIIRTESARLSELLAQHLSRDEILTALPRHDWTGTREEALAICGKYQGPKAHMKKVEMCVTAVMYFQRDVVMILFFGKDDVFVDFTYFWN